MDQDSDGIEEAFEGQLRVALTAAGRIAEIIARAREDSARRAQAGSEQQAREWSARLDAERTGARAQLAVVHQEAFWESADAEQIGRLAQVAGAWAGEEPEAMRARKVMRTQLIERFGIDLDDASGDPAAVREALERAQESQQGSQVSSTRVEQAEADHLVAAADVTDAAATRGAPAWDSSRRREESARGLRSMGVGDEQVSTAMLADVSQAKPARDAVSAKTGAWAKVEKQRGRGGPQIARTEQSR